MVNPNTEIARLKELMPASARMKIKIILNDRQIPVIKANFPRPWQSSHPVSLNMDLWQHLGVAERDLLFLRTIHWVMLANVLKPNGYQLLAGAGVAGGVLELMQGGRPLIENTEGKTQLEIVIEEIKRDKITIDYEQSDIDKPAGK